MSELEPIPKAPVCSICKQPKSRLRKLTLNKNEPIWICSEKPPKGKTPCDGRLFEIAQSNDLA